MLKPLPFATQTFRKIVEDGLLYVDKTKHIYELIQHVDFYIGGDI